MYTHTSTVKCEWQEAEEEEGRSEKRYSRLLNLG